MASKSSATGTKQFIHDIVFRKLGNFLGLLYPCSVGWRHLSEGQWLHEWYKPAHNAENHVEGGDGHQQELEGRIPEDAN